MSIFYTMAHAAHAMLAIMSATANSFQTETIFRYPSIVTIGLFIATGAIGYGGYKAVIAQLRKDFDEHRKEYAKETEVLTGMITHVDERLTRVADERRLYNQEHFVDRREHNSDMSEIKRRLDVLDSMEISAQLAEIKAMLKVALKDKLPNI